MEDFENLKKLWQEQKPESPKMDVSQLKKSNRSHQRKMERTQLGSVLILSLTALFITYIGFFSGIQFESSLTYVSIILIILLCVTQALINVSVYRRLRQLNVAASATDLLQKWEAYSHFRKKLVRINMPLYSIVLSLALGLYYVEIVGRFSVFYQILIWTLTLAWILFAHFVLGRRSLRKEYARLDALISTLRSLSQQLNQDSADQ